MAFVNYELLTQLYPSGQMEKNVRLLKDHDIFHCLLAGNTERAAAVKKHVAGLPEDFLKWLEVCDGGLLFDTAMLTTKSRDRELNLFFDTYGNYYDLELREGLNLSKDWFVFAVAVHSDVFFFDEGKRYEKVYQWDIEENTIYEEWDCFEDWLTCQINEALGLIANNKILPMGIKLENMGNG